MASPAQPPPDLNKRVITTQPGQNEPPVPSQYVLCPPGLEPLINASYLFVKQQVDMGEMFYNARNQYDVLTESGIRIYHVTEMTSGLVRWFDNNDMPYCLCVFDFFGRPIIQLAGRPDFCGSPGEINVYYSGFRLGTIKQVGGVCCGAPTYDVLNSANEIVLRIVSTQIVCCVGICGTAEFRVTSVNGQRQVGKISKMWGGILQEYFTSADNFGVSIPKDLDIQLKALLMSTAIMIDFQYFNKEKRRH